MQLRNLFLCLPCLCASLWAQERPPPADASTLPNQSSQVRYPHSTYTYTATYVMCYAQDITILVTSFTT